MYGLKDRNKYYNFNNNELASFFLIQ